MHSNSPVSITNEQFKNKKYESVHVQRTYLFDSDVMNRKMLGTDPETEKVLVELSKNATAAEKFARVCSLSQTVIQLSRQNIIKANKGISDRDAGILFVKLHYGSELADELSEYLERHDHLRRNNL